MMKAATWPAGAVVYMAVSLEDLKAQVETVYADMEAIVEKADTEDRDLSDAELKDVTAKKVKAEKLQAQIDAREMAKPTAGVGRRTKAEPGDKVPAQVRVDDPKGGFKSLGEFALLAKDAALGREVDPRIRAAAPSTAGSESVGADGGFAVPPAFRQEIYVKIMGEENLLQRTDQLVTGGNSLTIPADETTPWAGSGGIQAYWDSELGTLTQSKPNLQMKNIRLNKLTALVPVSEELLEDAPGMDGYLRAKAPVKMRAKLNTAVVRGSGAGQPQGILNAASLVTVAAVSGQGANTIVGRNISAMWARLYSECRRNAVWLINQDIEPQLDMLAFPGTESPVPLYMPAGGLSASPFATLKGRPVLPMQPCSTVGTVGDIILVDLSQYLSITKGQDIKTDVSIHLFFDAGALAYRFIMRVAGQPWWAAAADPENGSNTLSWAVALNSSRT